MIFAACPRSVERPAAVRPHWECTGSFQRRHLDECYFRGVYGENKANAVYGRNGGTKNSRMKGNEDGESTGLL